MSIDLCPIPHALSMQRYTPMSSAATPSLFHICVFGQSHSNQSEMLLQLPQETHLPVAQMLTA